MAVMRHVTHQEAPVPQPKIHASHAQRQAAYRQRCHQGRLQQLNEKGLPALPALPQIPGTARWKQALSNAIDLLTMVEQEMEAYYDDRSVTWQDGDKGNDFHNRLDALCRAREGVEEVDLCA